MLVWHYIILIFWIRWLVLRRDVDEFFGKVWGAVEFFEEVGVAGRGEVDVGVGGIFGLIGSEFVSGCEAGMGREGGWEGDGDAIPLWRLGLGLWQYNDNSG